MPVPFDTFCDVVISTTGILECDWLAVSDTTLALVAFAVGLAVAGLVGDSMLVLVVVGPAVAGFVRDTAVMVLAVELTVAELVCDIVVVFAAGLTVAGLVPFSPMLTPQLECCSIGTGSIMHPDLVRKEEEITK